MAPEMGDMLPEEIEQLEELKRQARIDRIEALATSIAKKRDDAVKHRQQSGIEDEWTEDEEAYQGIDDANRGESKTYKPDSPNGSSLFPKRDPSRSTVFMNITRPYVDAASARVGDMLLPTDDRNWGIKATPVPKLDAQKDSTEGVNNALGEPVMNAGTGQQTTVGDMAKDAIAQASKSAEKAQTQIDDWLTECMWHAEVRKMIEYSSKLGTGILKGPVPVKRKYRKVKKDSATGGSALVMEIFIAPETKCISPWNLYPAPDCGENIHHGSHIFERDDINARQLKDLKDVPGYLADQIDKVLEEGPNKKYGEMLGRSPSQMKAALENDRYDIWYYYGMLDREDLDAMGVDAENTKLEGVPAIVTMVNDTPIKATLNPLDSGDFPYDVMPWQRRSGHWAGVGVARQIRTPQKMLNAATRNLMDNAGLSGAPQVVVWKNKIVPADGVWSLTRGKLWFAKEDADIKGVADAFASFVIPSMQAELSNIIQFSLKIAEDVTGLPMIMQGQQGTAPDTVGGMQIVNNNASTVLRRIARTFDDYITEPHIRRYYEWLMMYGEDEEAKGDFVIDARGSTALVERDLQNQAIMGMANIVMNPAFGLSPEKWIKEALKAQRLDPKRFEMDDEEKQAMAQQQPPEAPQVTIAKIRAESDKYRTDKTVAASLQKTKMDTDRDTIYVQAQMQRGQAEAMSRREELQIKREIAYLELQINKGINVDDNKTKLAETAMKLRTQRDLAMMNAHAAQVASPPTEPPGRAPTGQAYQA